jgi:hypothetical protein
MGVELFVWRVSIVEQLDRQLEGENDEVTFPGKPETSNETALEKSESRTRLMLVETADPWIVERSPKLSILKSKFFGDPPAALLD